MPIPPKKDSNKKKTDWDLAIDELLSEPSVRKCLVRTRGEKRGGNSMISEAQECERDNTPNPPPPVRMPNPADRKRTLQRT